MKPNYLTLPGIALITFYLLIFFLIIRFIAKLKYDDDVKLKKLFIYAFLVKIFGGIGFGLIYDFHYNWLGDTHHYFINSNMLGDVFLKYPSVYFKHLFGFVTKENIGLLPTDAGYYPPFRDSTMYAIHRFLSPFAIVGAKNYYVTCIVLNTFLYLVNWKFFSFLVKLFPDRKKLIAIAVLFVPSALFWSSGLVKDAFTFSFALLFIVGFYNLFFNFRINFWNIFYLVFSAYIILSIKPYILYSLLISSVIWLGFSYLQRVRNRILRVFVFPILMLSLGFAGLYVFCTISSSVGGAYKDVDSMLSKATIAQRDLKQEYYKGSAFDIGDYDASIEGAMSVTPAAIMAGLFRPFVWEARSMVVMLSGIENFVLLALTLYLLFVVGIRRVVSSVAKNPFLIFCLVFSLSMAMGIGLSTSNFGALVRFKIPLVPFFVMFLLFIREDYKKEKSL